MNSPPTNAGTLGGDATLGRPARSGVRLRAATLALGLVAAALGALAIGVVAVRQPASPLPVLGTVPVFELTEASGRPISRAELAGKLWIADFVFTSCAASCPKMTAEMARIQQGERDLADLRLVSFSVDPETDTPEVLRGYAARHQADPSRWLFVTGDPAKLRSLAIDGFHIPVGNGDPTQGDAPIIHSDRFVLVDRQAQIRGYYEATDGDALLKLRGDVRRLAQEPAP